MMRFTRWKIIRRFFAKLFTLINADSDPLSTIIKLFIISCLLSVCGLNEVAKNSNFLITAKV